MKILLLLVLLLTFQGDDDSDLIQWNEESKLKWENFEGKVPNVSGFQKAITYSSISIRSDYYEGSLPNYIVKSLFHKKKSWTNTNSQEHLDHENLHFDITEVHSRKIRKSIDSLQQLGEEDAVCYKKVYRKILSKLQDAQRKYDNEVYSSDIKQQIWIDSISQELKELENFKYVTKD